MSRHTKHTASLAPQRDPRSVTAFAPATIGNVGPGFDVLGMAVSAPGDRVTARVADKPGIHLVSIEGDDGRLPTDPDENTAAIAARHTLERAGVDVGVELELVKGMPIGSGLGSSAASAAAAAFAVNMLVGSPLRKSELVEPCVEAEATVSGRHADNVAPALLGGLIMVRSLEPLELVRIPVPQGLRVVVVTPAFELSTREARAALPQQVPLTGMVANMSHLAAFISACYSGDLDLLSRCVVDDIVNAARAPLIPGGEKAMSAALSTGALGSSISGAGPSIFAFCRSSRSAGEVGAAMAAAFTTAGLSSTIWESPADCPGARML